MPTKLDHRHHLAMSTSGGGATPLAALIVCLLLSLGPLALAQPAPPAPLPPSIQAGESGGAARGSGQSGTAVAPRAFVPPWVRRKVEAVYPKEAAATGLQAKVVLELLVDEQGRVNQAKVIEAAGHGFDEAAMAAVQQFEFVPGQADGKPVPVRVTYVYRFLFRQPAAGAGSAQPGAPPAAGSPSITGAGAATGGAAAIDAATGAGAAATAYRPALGRLRGRVLERGTRAPLAMAVVEATWLEPLPRPPHTPPPGEPPARLRTPDGQLVSPPEMPVRTVETDSAGYFEIAHLPAGRYRVVVREPEHRLLETRELLAERELLTVAYYLERRGRGRYETVVRGRVQREEVARTTLESDEIAKIPGTFGDVLRAIENLPGAARAPFNSGLLIIRGGKPTDSRVFIEGAAVPQLYHFGGLTSVVPTALVGSIEYLPGNFSSRYGRATAGVIDLEFKPGRRDRLHGRIDTNVFDTGVVVDGPLGRGSFALAARRSYIDAVLPAVLPDDAGLDFTTAPRYYDYQALLDLPLAGGTLRGRLFGSDDALSFIRGHASAANRLLRGNFDTRIFFHKLQGWWQRRRGRLDISSLLAGGVMGTYIDIGPEMSFDLLTYQIDLRGEAGYAVTPRFRLVSGLDLQVGGGQLSARIPQPPREGEVRVSGVTTDDLISVDTRLGPGANLGLWAEAELQLGPRVLLVPGVRFDYYHFIRKVTLDPRLSLRITASPTTTLRAGVGLYSRDPDPQDSNDGFGNPALGAEHALHVGAGIDQVLFGDLTLEASLFYKWLFELATLSSATVARDGRVVPEVLWNQGVGRVYGGELFLRQHLGRNFWGWLSYTLMRSERRDRCGQPFRPFDFDQTHVLTLALHYDLPYGFEVGLRFRFVSGNPTTEILGGIYDADSDHYYRIPGPTNGIRLPSYHQLDLRVDKTFTFKTWMLGLYIDVQNVYNHENVEAIRYNYDYTQHAYLTGLPIIPTLGVKAEF